MAFVVSGGDLKVAQWIKFTTGEDLSTQSAETQAIYQENQRYLVFFREDRLSDPCRCRLIDMKGEIINYCARMHSLGSSQLVWDGNITVVTKQSVETIHGAELVSAIYAEAQRCLA